MAGFVYTQVLLACTQINLFDILAKGALSFDDYSYKYFNEVVLNPKALKAINEEEDDILNRSVSK